MMKDVDAEPEFSLSFRYNGCVTFYLGSLSLAFHAILQMVTLSKTISHQVYEGEDQNLVKLHPLGIQHCERN